METPLDPAHCNAFWETPIRTEYYGVEHVCTKPATVDGKTCEEHTGFYDGDFWLQEMTKYCYDFEHIPSCRDNTPLRRKHAIFALSSGRVKLTEEHARYFPHHFYKSDGSTLVPTHWSGLAREYQQKYSCFAFMIFQYVAHWERSWFELLWRRAVRMWLKKLYYSVYHGPQPSTFQLITDGLNLIQTPQDARDIFNLSGFHWIGQTFIYASPPETSAKFIWGNVWTDLLKKVLKKHPSLACDPTFHSQVITQIFALHTDISPPQKKMDSFKMEINTIFEAQKGEFYKTLRSSPCALVAKDAAIAAAAPNRVNYILETYGIEAVDAFFG